MKQDTFRGFWQYPLCRWVALANLHALPVLPSSWQLLAKGGIEITSLNPWRVSMSHKADHSSKITQHKRKHHPLKKMLPIPGNRCRYWHNIIMWCMIKYQIIILTCDYESFISIDSLWLSVSCTAQFHGLSASRLSQWVLAASWLPASC